MLTKMTMLDELQNQGRVCDILATLYLKGQIYKRQIELSTGAHQETIKKSMRWCEEQGLVEIKRRKKKGFSTPTVFYSLTEKGRKVATHIIEIEEILKPKS